MDGFGRGSPAAREVTLLAAVLYGLKKLLAFWIMPLPFCVLLLGLGLWCLRSPRRAKLGRRLIWTGAILLLAFTNKFVSSALVRPLEEKYPSIPELRADAPPPAALARCRYVVVLGSGHGNTPGRPALTELSEAARARITEAVRLLRVLPDARLVVTGPPIGTFASHAAKLSESAVALGIDARRIVLIEDVRDTEDESLAVRRIVGDAPFALVTSAWHMPRAVALCRAAGLDPLPCPTDYTAHSDGRFYFGDLLWDRESLDRSTWAVRERIGYLWIWLRGKGGR